MRRKSGESPSALGTIAMAGAMALTCSACLAAEPDYSQDLPRLAPLEPAKAIESFRVAKGFQIELVAAEPLVTDPVAMAFDEDGRLFVVEMRDYSEHPNDHLGQVRMLEDTNGDGRMDHSTIFAEKLSWPTAIICSQGGVFIGAAPHILQLKDTDGDGKADVNKIVYTGLGRGNVQGLVNTFLYGLDHRIHVAASSAAGTLTRPDDPTFKPIPLRGRDFAFDPITFAAQAITGGGQHGASFDDYGRRFVCSNSDHLQMVMIEDRYTVNSAPGLASPPARMSIAADGPQAEVYRISPVEPWRVLRTKLRVSGTVPGPIEGGGRAAGYFTSATGLTIYRGDAMPDQRGNAFVADVGSNIIHRKKLTPRGIGFIGTRIDEKTEFIASTDTWFRPVQMVNAPDGCLWVADMYREVIEHPASLPPAIKKHLDLNSGRDRGRIYRIAPEGFKPRAIPKLSKATTAQLVALFEHDNAWHRETASRLIRERKDFAAVEPMRKMLKAYGKPLGRLHSMYGLEGQNQLTRDDVIAGIGSADFDLCENAIRLAEQFMASDIKVFAWVMGAADDHSERLQFQAILSLGYGDPAKRPVAVLESMLQPHGRYTLWAAINSVGGDVLPLIDASFHRQRIEPEILVSLVEEIPAKDLTAVLDRLPRDAAAFEKGHDSLFPIVLSLVSRINRAGDDPEALFAKHAPFVSTMLPMLITTGEALLKVKTLDAAKTRHAVQMLTSGTPTKSISRISGLLAPDQPPSVQQAAATILGEFPQAEATPHLLENVNLATPQTRAILLDALLARRVRIAALLDALETSKVPTTSLTADHRMRLISTPGEMLRARAAKLFAPSADRQAIVERYLKESATLAGNTARGKQLFAAQCAACHKLDNQGHELGPNLAAFAQRGNEAILTNLLDPNREVNPAFLNHIVELKDGDIVTGIITSESASSLTLASGNGASRTIARSNIESLRATGKSLMPEGIEATLSVSDAADLLSYLNSLKEIKP